jgi:hypothetical protein
MVGVLKGINFEYIFLHSPLKTVEVLQHVANEQRRLAVSGRNGRAFRIEGKLTVGEGE